ncbi:hypothetical protein [Halobaculum lipolyticum]|uniref:Uncharacterized protein n=1 Tax=Halobaculum lipolyticum TaxID=3032001 RepID=A0ABD5WD72_9EURY|nr:hypothetical protein [Halobaculum sp. DT31]
MLAFVSVVFPLLVAAWVFRDATSRGWPLAARVTVAAAVAGSSLFVVVIGPLAGAVGYFALTRR